MWTAEQAAEIQPRPKFARRRVIVNERAFKSLKAAAEDHGLNWKKMHDRVVAKGWTVEQALEQVAPPESVKYRGLTLSAFGQSFASFGECARHFGIKPESLRNRVKNYGDAVEAAIRHLQTKPRPGRQRDQSKDR